MLSKLVKSFRFSSNADNVILVNFEDTFHNLLSELQFYHIFWIIFPK